MLTKRDEKVKAVQFRGQGYSYSDIRKHVNVSKSTLSLWLRDIELDKSAKTRLRRKLLKAQKLGAETRRRQRIEKVLRIEKHAISEVPQINKNDVFLMGIMLYWAEGSKQKKGDPSQSVEFSNSDPNMCRFYLKWLRISIGVSDTDIVPCIYIHESKGNIKENALEYWSQQINFPKSSFGRTCVTKTVYPRKSQRQIVDVYYGQLRIRVKRSTDLNRKIAGWTKGVCIKSGVASQNFV